MASRKKSKYKLYENDDWSQWHGAQEQARRLIEEVLPLLDEALQKSEVIQTTENLSRYISEVNILYSNVSSILMKKTDKKIAFEYMHKLLEAKRKILSKGVVSKNYYFNLHDCVANFDMWLRTKVQDIGLLYRVIKKKSGNQYLRDLMKHSDKAPIDKMIKTSPYLLSKFDIENMQDEFK